MPMVVSLPITCTHTIVMASLCVGLTLPGMIDDPGSFSGRISSPNPARGPDASQRMSLAIFMSDTASVLSAPLAITSASCAARAANLFGADTNGRPVRLGDLRGGALGELGVRVEPGADGGAADGELVEAGQHRLDALEVGVELRDVAAELLAEGERHRVLQVGAADLDDVAELFRLRRQRVTQARDRGHELVHHLLGGGDVHRGRERVVRALRHVDVVVGVDGLLAAHLAAGQLDGAVRDHLVDVHVGLGAAAGLPHEERELVAVLARDHLVGRLHEHRCLLGRQLAELLVDLRGGLLEDGHRPG